MNRSAKKFEAPSLREAMDMVVSDLGKEAVVLSSRQTTKRAMFGLLEKPCAEIVACRSGDVRMMRDEIGAHDIHRKRPGTTQVRLPQAESKSRLLDQAYKISARKRKENDDGFGDLYKEVKSLKTMMMDVVKVIRTKGIPSYTDAMTHAYMMLLDNHVSENIAQDVLKNVNADLKGVDLEDAKIVRERLVFHLSRLVPVSGRITLKPNSGKYITVIGPTGVGKTTTLAKLAAHYSIREKRQVGLITLDTYRIAAVDQLRTYAGIIDIPLQVASSPRDLKAKLESLGQCDLIFLDSAGRSQQDPLKMNELTRFLEEASPDEIHLVADVGADRNRLFDVMDRFNGFRVDRLLLTKLDEVSSFGVIPSLLARVGCPLSYVTTGQNVPEDIMVGESEKIARLILGERWESWQRN